MRFRLSPEWRVSFAEMARLFCRNGAFLLPEWRRLFCFAVYSEMGSMKRILSVLVFAAAAVSAASGCEEIADCFAGRQAAEMFKDVVKNAERRGKRAFGEEFKMHNRVRFSQYRRGFEGDLDAVIPGNGFMLQSGMTAWDSRKMGGRRDLRLGVVHRRADAEGWYGGMWGVWGFGQMDSVGGDMRFVGGGEYTGKFGKMTAAYYFGGGRIMSGGDVRLDLDLTRRLSLDGNVSHWKSRTDSAEYLTNAKLSANYEWREWFAVGGELRKTANKPPLWTAKAELQIPLGAPKKRRKSAYKRDYDKMLLSPVARFKRLEYAAH